MIWLATLHWIWSVGLLHTAVGYNILPLIDPSVCLFLLSDSQLGQICFHLTQLGSQALVLAGLDVEVGLNTVIHFGFNELIWLFDEVADITKEINTLSNLIETVFDD